MILLANVLAKQDTLVLNVQITVIVMVLKVTEVSTKKLKSVPIYTEKAKWLL